LLRAIALAMTFLHSVTEPLLLSLRGVERRSNLMERQYYVYVMTNKNNTVLYTGVTNDLIRRVYEHKQKLINGFTRKYNVTKLVYFEVFRDIKNAIMREKQIKAGSRSKKIELINRINSKWNDLYDSL